MAQLSGGVGQVIPIVQDAGGKQYHVIGLQCEPWSARGCGNSPERSPAPGPERPPGNGKPSVVE